MAVKLIFVGLLLFVAALHTHCTKNNKNVKKNLPKRVPGKLHICNLFVIVIDVSYNFLSRVLYFFFLSCVSLIQERCYNASNLIKKTKGVQIKVKNDRRSKNADHWFYGVGI